jgi:protein O-GlcNAc transferase
MHPGKLAALREKLAENQRTHPLFDTTRFARDIEQAYRWMYGRCQEGLAPDHMTVGT